MVSFSFPLVATEQIGLLSRVSAWFPHSTPIFWIYPVLTITSALVKPKLVTSINAVKQTDFILSIKCRGLLLRYALLIAFAFVLLLSSRDLLKVSTQPLYASVHATMFLSLLRKVSHIVSIKSGHYFRLTQSQNI